MRTRTIALTVGLLALTSMAPAATMVMDACETYLDGSPIYDYLGDECVGIRITIDNSEGASDMTGVRFTGDSLSGTVDRLGNWWSINEDNPWYGSEWLGSHDVTLDHAVYKMGIVTYGRLPDGPQWGTAWGVTLLPEHPDWVPDPNEDGLNSREIFDAVPVGLVWDAYLSVVGTDLELFHSPAEGTVDHDGTSTTLLDYDPLPQTAIPEPVTLGLLGVGALGLLRRRK